MQGNVIFQQAEVKRFKMKVGVMLVLVEEGEVLLLRRHNTGIADGLHVLPMGGVNDGETASDALIREAQEEVNVTIAPHALQLVHTMHRHHHMPDGDTFKQIDLFFMPTSFHGEIRNGEPHKCDEVSFYPLNALPDTTENFVRQALTCIQKREAYSECGWEVD